MENVEHTMHGNQWQFSKTGRALRTNQRKAIATIAKSVSTEPNRWSQKLTLEIIAFQQKELIKFYK